MSSKKVLNTAPPSGDVAISTPELARDLQRLMLSMKGRYMREDGRGVDYAALKQSEEFKEYLVKAGALAGADPGSLDEDQRKCFFINIYNALTIHVLVDQDGLRSTVLDIPDLWQFTCYNIGGMVYSLDDIEHGILRGDRPHPSKSSVMKTFFEKDDKRAELAFPKLDPRIHFALVCGAQSCPPIQVYTPENLNRALESAAINFCTQEVIVEENQHQVTLSKIFFWYKSDFGETTRDMLMFVVQYLDEMGQSKLERMLQKDKEIEIKWKDYNWSINKL